MKKLICLLLVFAFVFTCFAGCKPLTIEHGNADQSKLYGVCYVGTERDYGNADYDPVKEAQLLKNMGVTSVRNWMHVTNMLTDPVTVNRKKADRMHTLIAEFQKHDIFVIGMSHTNFNEGTNTSGKMARDITPGSAYIAWLEDYYTAWKTLVTEFPEVTYWEIDNEINNADFMKTIYKEAVFTQTQMAQISTDLLYYASRAIHEANPKAKTVLGGLVGAMSGKAVTFLQRLYDNIASGKYGYFYGQESEADASTDPDDYFEIACWHPYISSSFDKEKFVEYNGKVYQVILDNEKKHKPVILSEIGFSNSTYTEEAAAKFITDLYTVVKERMPYIEAVTYFKMYDYADPASYWMGAISRYGLFYDPNPDREYTAGTGEANQARVNPGQPKPAAYAFKEVAGGTGDITIMMTDLG